MNHDGLLKKSSFWSSRNLVASTFHSRNGSNNQSLQRWVDTHLQVINAETTELANERNTINILRRRMQASVLLIKVLGGGWDVSELPTFGARRMKDY
jgi:outer membrane protein TolC